MRTLRVADMHEVAGTAVLPELDSVFADAIEAMRRNAPAATAPAAPSASADVVWKVLVGADRHLDRGEILHAAKNAGLNGGSLFRSVSPRARGAVRRPARRVPDRAHR